jgi:hypothetical protein
VKRLHKVLFALLIFCISAINLPVQAMTPLEVAVLPVINTADYKYTEDIQIIESKIREPFKYPFYSVIPSNNAVEAEMAAIVNNKAVRLSDEQTMAALAEKLAADIVIAVELSRADFREFTDFWHEENYIESAIVLKCYAYSAVDKKAHVIKATRFTTDTYTVNTTAAVFFQELTEEILTKLPYKRIPTPEIQKRIADYHLDKDR